MMPTSFKFPVFFISLFIFFLTVAYLASAKSADTGSTYSAQHSDPTLMDHQSSNLGPAPSQELSPSPSKGSLNEEFKVENTSQTPSFDSQAPPFYSEHSTQAYSSQLESFSGSNPTFDTSPSYTHSGSFEQNEILSAGHAFFGTVTEGLARGIEYLFQSQGNPNAYILGEDAGGALLIGLRYGEGLMYLKNSPPEKVFWQGPTIGYDAGAEGSKTMILVYNLKDPSEIYDRYAGVQGTAYFVGGLSIQLQKHDYVTLAVIRSGVGLRLGANIGYLNYTRTPTWNPL